MMSPSQQLPFYHSLLRIHAVISRGLEVTSTHSLEFAEKGFADENIQIGFYRYVYSLLIVLETHHQTEEVVAFPYFQARLPSLRIEPVIEQHRQMRPHIVTMEAAVEKIAPSTETPTDALNQLAQACKNLQILWMMHAPAEENYFVTNSISALELTYEEQLDITRRTAEYNQKISKYPQGVVPFILYNLPPDEREQMAQGMPPEVITMLIPTMWKSEWAPMKPFLLD
jgi:hemerythrin-like domain-containing protein